MARPLRIQYPGAWYHVTSRGNERRDIFTDDADRGRWLEILAQSASIYGAEIHAYVLMNNHFHLVVHTPQANLNRFMQRFNTTYTVYFNRRHYRHGHLFQGRYKALLVDADSYLIELSRYVHLNPVRVMQNASLSLSAKREVLQRYQWSSYGGYTHLGKRLAFLDCGKVLSMIGTGDDARSRRAYRRFVQKGLDGSHTFDLKEEVRAQTVLGSEDFREWLRDRFLSGTGREYAERPAARALMIRFRSPDAIAARLSPVLAVAFDDLLRARSRYRDERAIFLELCRRHLSGGRSMSSIAADLGIGVSALSQNRKRLGARMETDPHLRKQFERAESVLSDSEQ
ncbi:MAG: transposase [Desulfobacterales bacterium]|nr:transposase [Desulfobacterales bacterium]